MGEKSKLQNRITLVSGSNRKLNTEEEIKKYIHKRYDAENGSGFYSIKDIEIATLYAKKAAADYGGTAYLNYFELDFNKLIQDNISRAYFNEIDEDTMEYLGYNINGKLPPHCPLNKYRNLRPKDVCMECKETDCSWNSEYIESILLDCIDTNFTDIILDYYDGKIDLVEADDRFKEKLDEYTGGKFKFQVVLRGRILDLDNHYLEPTAQIPV